MIEYKLNNISNKGIICEMYRRVLAAADSLGVEPPALENKMARILGPDGLSACHPIDNRYYPEWLKKDLDHVMTTADLFLDSHEAEPAENHEAVALESHETAALASEC